LYVFKDPGKLDAGQPDYGYIQSADVIISGSGAVTALSGRAANRLF